MQHPSTRFLLPLVFGLCACQGQATSGDGNGDGGSSPDSAPTTFNAFRPATAIRHVVVIVEENHTFDSYFGRYCTGASGVTCTSGPGCCEAAPSSQPAILGTQSAGVLDSASNYAEDRNHTASCELSEMDWDGQKYAMDKYVYGAGIGCSSSANFALVDPGQKADDTGVSSVYWKYAQSYALAARYFQPVIGSTSSNDMFLVTAQFNFLDNQAFPQALGTACQISYQNYLPPPLQSKPQIVAFNNTTIADLLIRAVPELPFGHYHQGYQAIQDAAKNGTLDRDQCPPVPSDCHVLAANVNAAPCSYDPSDNPLRYFPQFADGAPYAKKYLRDYADLAQDVSSGQLPAVAFVKALTYVNEHPNWSHIYEGTALVDKTVAQVLSRDHGEMINGSFVPYADSTLVLLTWDEGGGFYDHVSPPQKAPVDGRSYGTRVPMLAIGRFAKKNYVSQVQLEHSSIVKFIEWNFLGKRSGQLAATNSPTTLGMATDLPRDAAVNNLGDLLDATQTGTPVPSDNND